MIQHHTGFIKPTQRRRRKKRKHQRKTSSGYKTFLLSKHGSRSQATGYDEEYLQESCPPTHRSHPQKCLPRSSATPSFSAAPQTPLQKRAPQAKHKRWSNPATISSLAKPRRRSERWERERERERNAKEPEPEDTLALGFASPNQF